jgi:hypothetical protein
MAVSLIPWAIVAVLVAFLALVLIGGESIGDIVVLLMSSLCVGIVPFLVARALWKKGRTSSKRAAETTRVHQEQKAAKAQADRVVSILQPALAAAEPALRNAKSVRSRFSID